MLEDRTLLSGPDVNLTAAADRLADIFRSTGQALNTGLSAARQIPLLGAQLGQLKPLQDLSGSLIHLSDEIHSLGTRVIDQARSLLQDHLGTVVTAALPGWLGDTDRDGHPGETGAGGDILVDLESSHSLRVTLLLHKEFDFSASSDQNLGFGSLIDVGTKVGVDVKLTMDDLLQFTIDANGPTVTLNHTDLAPYNSALAGVPMGFHLQAGLTPGTRLGGTIGGVVSFGASDLLGDQKTGVDGTLAVSLSMNHGTWQADATFQGHAHIGLKAGMSLSTPTLSFGSEIVGNWNYGRAVPLAQLGAGFGALGYKDITLNTDSLLASGGILSNVLDDLHHFIEPLHPIISFLESEMPILNKVGIHLKVVDLLAQFGGGPIKPLVDALDFIDRLALGHGSGDLNLGSFTIASGGPNGPFGVAAGADPHNQLDAFKASTGGQGSDLAAKAGFYFPIVEDPLHSIFRLLTGDVGVDVVAVHFPTVGPLHLELSFPFGIKGILAVSLVGSFDIGANLSMGYDLTGLRDHNAIHGFYVDQQHSNLYIHSFLGLNGDAALVHLSGGLHADIELHPDSSLVDKDPKTGQDISYPDYPSDGGTHRRVRLDRLVDRILDDPLNAFEATGQIYVGASIWIGLDLPIVGTFTLFSLDLAHDVLVDFNHRRTPADRPPDFLNHIYYLAMTDSSDNITIQPFLARVTIDGREMDEFGYDFNYAFPPHTVEKPSLYFDPGTGLHIDRNPGDWIAMIATSSASDGDDVIVINPIEDRRPAGSRSPYIPTTLALIYGGKGNDTLVNASDHLSLSLFDHHYTNGVVRSVFVGGDGDDRATVESFPQFNNYGIDFYNVYAAATMPKAFGDGAGGFLPWNDDSLVISETSPYHDGTYSFRPDLGTIQSDPAARIFLEGALAAVSFHPGNDTLVGRDLDGGPGDDFLIGDGRLVGGPGADTLVPTTVSYDTQNLYPGEGADTIILQDWTFFRPFNRPRATVKIIPPSFTKFDGDTLIVRPFLTTQTDPAKRGDTVAVGSFGGILVIQSPYLDVWAYGMEHVTVDGFRTVEIDSTFADGLRNLAVGLPDGPTRVRVQSWENNQVYRDVSDHDIFSPGVLRIHAIDPARTSAEIARTSAEIFVNGLGADDSLEFFDTGAISSLYLIAMDSFLNPAHDWDVVPIRINDPGGPGDGDRVILDADYPRNHILGGTTFDLGDGSFRMLASDGRLMASVSWPSSSHMHIDAYLPRPVDAAPFHFPGAKSASVHRSTDTTPVSIHAPSGADKGFAFNVFGGGNVTLVGSRNDDQYNIVGSSADVTIQGVDGNDTISIGTQGNAGAVRGKVTLIDPYPVDLPSALAYILNLDGSSFASPKVVNINRTTVTGLFPGTVEFTSPDRVSLHVIPNPKELVDVNDTPGFTSLDVRGDRVGLFGTTGPIRLLINAAVIPTIEAIPRVDFRGPVSFDGTLPHHYHLVVAGPGANGTLDVEQYGFLNLLSHFVISGLTTAPISFDYGPLLADLRFSLSARQSLTLKRTPAVRVTIVGQGGNVVIAGTSGPVTVSNAHVTIGTGTLATIQGPVQVGTTSDTLSSSIFIDDSTDGASRRLIVDKAATPDSTGVVSGLGPAISFYAPKIRYVTINTSSTVPGTVEVRDTLAETLVDLRASSATVRKTTRPLSLYNGSSITVATRSPDDIKGPIFIPYIWASPTAGQGPALTLDDSADPTGRTVTFANNGFHHIDGDPTTYTVNGLYPAPLSFDLILLRSFTLKLGAGNDTLSLPGLPSPSILSGFLPGGQVYNTGSGNDQVNIDLTAAGSPVRVNAGPGDDTINVCPTGKSLDTIKGTLAIDGGTGSDRIRIFDSAKTGPQAYTLNAGSWGRTGMASISYILDGGYDSLDLFTGSGDNNVLIKNTNGNVTYTTLTDGPGNDRVSILNSAPNSYLFIEGGGGSDVIRLGSIAPAGGDTLPNRGNGDTLKGSIQPYNDGGRTVVVVDDSGHLGGRSDVRIGYSALAGITGGLIRYQVGQDDLIVHGGRDGNTFNVDSLLGYDATTLNTGPGNDTVNIVNFFPYMLTSLLTVNGQGGTDKLNVDFRDASAPLTLTTGPTSLSVANISHRSGSPALLSIVYDNTVESVKVTTGSGDDTFRVTGQSSTPALAFDGGAGNNWLDYSQQTASVTVNLATGVASYIAGGVQNVQNVAGGSGNDALAGGSSGGVLLGNGGDDRLQGGAGRSVLIGGSGADTITGGAADDLLIAGSTASDGDFTALEAILDEWQSSHSYAARLARLRSGVGPRTSTRLLWGTTVVDDLARDLLTGGAGLDWFFGSSTGSTADVTDRNALVGEQQN